MPTLKFVKLRGFIDDNITGQSVTAARISLRNPLIIIDTDDGRIRIPQSERVITGDQLAIGVDVLATDDENANPSQWYYELTEFWTGGRVNKRIVLPSNAPSGVVDYWKLVDAPEVNLTVPILIRSVNNVLPDAQGNITIATTGGGGGGTTDPGNLVLDGVVKGPPGATTFAVDMATQAELVAFTNQRSRPRGPWATGTVYEINDIVEFRNPTNDPAGANTTYRCFKQHTSVGTSIDFSSFTEWGATGTRNNWLYNTDAFKPSTYYRTNQTVRRPSDDAIQQAYLNFTSGASFDQTNWRDISGTGATGGGTTPAGSDLELPQTATSTFGVGTRTSTGLANGTPAAGAAQTPNPVYVVYVPVLADGGKTHKMAEGTFLIPPHSEVAYPIGTVLRVQQTGTKQITILPGAGVQLDSPASNFTRTKFSTVKATKYGLYEWTLSEDIAPVVLPTSMSVTAAMSTPDHNIDNVGLFSFDVTGYTGDAGDVRDSASVVRTHTTNLQAGFYRFALKWDEATQKPYCGADSGINDAAGAQSWIDGLNAAKPTSGKIIAILSGDHKRTDLVNNVPDTKHGDMSISPQDAMKIVDYAVANNWGITDWIYGNEPELLSAKKVDYLGRSTIDSRNAGKSFVDVMAPIKFKYPTHRIWGPVASQLSGRIRTNVADETNQALPQGDPGAVAPYGYGPPGHILRWHNDWIVQSSPIDGHGTVKVLDVLDVYAWHWYLLGNQSGTNPVWDLNASPVAAQTGIPTGQVTATRTWAEAKAKQAGFSDADAATVASELAYSVNEMCLYYIPGDNKNSFQGGKVGGSVIRDTDKTVLSNGGFLYYDERATTAEMTVYAASVYGNMTKLSSTAYMFWFGDIVGPLGMFTRNDYDPAATNPAKKGDRLGPPETAKYFPHGKPAGRRYPSYYGIGMWTGMSLFRRFGASITATPVGNAANLEKYASTSNNGTTGDVMFINKDETNTRVVDLTTTGITTAPYQVWQTNRFAPWDPPTMVKSGASYTGSVITGIVLPPMTVTRVVLTP